jgi:carbonic anhydrase
MLVQITLNELSERPFIVGSAVNGDKFIFQELHPHWGIEDREGSEHSIDNQKFAAEVLLFNVG